MNIKIIIKSLLLSVFIVFISATSCHALNLKDAFGSSGSNGGLLNEAASNAGYNTSNTNLESVVGTAIAMVLSLLGIIFLVLIIYGGYTWMTARGEQEKVKNAQGIIKTSIIGLIIILAAYAISFFVISKLASGTLKDAGTVGSGGTGTVISQ